MTSRAAYATPVRRWVTYPGARIPSQGVLRARGMAYFVLMFVLLALLPFAVVESVVALGYVTLAVSPDVILGVGALQALLEGMTVSTRPTPSYGPVLMVASLVALGYLAIFLTSSAVTVSVDTSSGPLGIQVFYSPLVLLLMVAPGLRLLSGVATTFEDHWHPGERLPFDYPA
jgi:hypothetical protein